MVAGGGSSGKTLDVSPGQEILVPRFRRLPPHGPRYGKPNPRIAASIERDTRPRHVRSNRSNPGLNLYGNHQLRPTDHAAAHTTAAHPAAEEEHSADVPSSEPDPAGGAESRGRAHSAAA